MPFPSEEEVERLLALPPSPLISLSPPSAEERLARYLAAPALPSSPLPIVPHPYGSPNIACTSRLQSFHGVDRRETFPSLSLPPRRCYVWLLHIGAMAFIDGLGIPNIDCDEDRQFYHETALLLDQEALASQEAWVHLLGLSLAVHYELQAYRTHTQIQDHRIASQEALTSTLAAHVLFLQGQLSAALGQIQELQARDPTHADDPEGADSCA
ncbi:hypothetical protein Tco_1504880 [Tanacetum coccineum]